MPNPSTVKNKKHLRQQLRQIAVTDPVGASDRIVEKLIELLQQHPDWQCIALFLALPGEPDLRALSAHFPDRHFVYPRVEGNDLHFHRVNDPEQQLVDGPWGLLEPKISLPVFEAAAIDMMLCPGLAFTPDGKRLGKGGGFYDRYLAASAASRPYCIGVCFASYLCADLPNESHDICMDQIVSEG